MKFRCIWKLGFEQYLDPEQALVVNQMFVKPIDTFNTSDEMLAAFSPSLKRDLKNLPLWMSKLKS